MTTTAHLTISRRHLLAGAGFAALAGTLAACGNTSSDTQGAAGTTLTVVTHDSFELPKELISEFEKKSGVTLSVVAAGDAGEMVNKLILSKDAPLGDVVFGVDNTFASRVLAADVLQEAETVPAIPQDAKSFLVNDQTTLIPIDFGEVCLNYDIAALEKDGLAAPSGFEDLLQPEYASRTVLINPATSSTGLVFLLATIGHFGVDGFADYWRQIVAAGVRIDEGWSDAYFTDFTGGSENGTYPIVLSYSSSPSATLNEAGTESSTAAVLTTASRQVEYAGVLAGTKHPKEAAAFLEWMLSAPVQSAIPDSMYMYPVNPEAKVPDALTTFGPLSSDPIMLSPDDISEHREEWLQMWAEAVGR